MLSCCFLLAAAVCGCPYSSGACAAGWSGAASLELRLCMHAVCMPHVLLLFRHHLNKPVSSCIPCCAGDQAYGPHNSSDLLAAGGAATAGSLEAANGWAPFNHKQVRGVCSASATGFSGWAAAVANATPCHRPSLANCACGTWPCWPSTALHCEMLCSAAPSHLSCAVARCTMSAEWQGAARPAGPCLPGRLRQ